VATVRSAGGSDFSNGLILDNFFVKSFLWDSEPFHHLIARSCNSTTFLSGLNLTIIFSLVIDAVVNVINVLRNNLKAIFTYDFFVIIVHFFVVVVHILVKVRPFFFVVRFFVVIVAVVFVVIFRPEVIHDTVEHIGELRSVISFKSIVHPSEISIKTEGVKHLFSVINDDGSSSFSLIITKEGINLLRLEIILNVFGDDVSSNGLDGFIVVRECLTSVGKDFLEEVHVLLLVVVVFVAVLSSPVVL